MTLMEEEITNTSVGWNAKSYGEQALQDGKTDSPTEEGKETQDRQTNVPIWAVAQENVRMEKNH